MASLGVACNQIANTDNTNEKNELLVESLGSFTSGAIYTGATTLAVFMMATPVGWVGALAIGAAGAWLSYKTGQKSKELYSLYGNNYDLVGQTGIGKFCK